MQPIPGALKSGLCVQNTSFLGVSDVFNGSMGSTSSGESLTPERNNSAIYKNYFKQVGDQVANADVSLDGGGCPQGKDCDENMVSLISGSEPKVVGGHVFSSLELAFEKSTEYIVKGIFDKFGWNKDYQDGTILAASLFFSKGRSSKVAAKTVKTLQTGGHTLNKSTLKALNLTKEQGKNAIEALKTAERLPPNFHGKIMSNGDLVHPQTKQVLGNLFDYLP